MPTDIDLNRSIAGGAAAPACPAELIASGPVIPVATLDDPERGLRAADALCEGGVTSIEVTLRTARALDVIERIARARPDFWVGVGTVRTPQDLSRAVDAGARFAVTPGTTGELFTALGASGIPALPGVITPSEIMTAMARGFRTMKFFPAAAAGGLSALSALGGPFPEVQFCPTGGVTGANAFAYLALPNVSCVGGSWLLPNAEIANQDWAAITNRARTALADLRTAG